VIAVVMDVALEEAVRGGNRDGADTAMAAPVLMVNGIHHVRIFYVLLAIEK